jgi:hypothetical protein
MNIPEATDPGPELEFMGFRQRCELRHDDLTVGHNTRAYLSSIANASYCSTGSVKRLVKVDRVSVGCEFENENSPTSRG